MRIVGILLIAALMVLPVIAAGRIRTSIRSTMLLSMESASCLSRPV
jgi:ABC-type Mn2+/Zn2+ transport system permease subunit